MAAANEPVINPWHKIVTEDATYLVMGELDGSGEMGHQMTIMDKAFVSKLLKATCKPEHLFSHRPLSFAPPKPYVFLDSRGNVISGGLFEYGKPSGLVPYVCEKRGDRIYFKNRMKRVPQRYVLIYDILDDDVRKFITDLWN